MSPLFLAVVEAVEEAVLNSLFAASATKPVKTKNNKLLKPLPVRDVLKILKKYNRLK
jgi:D-aminopeptidase